MYDREKPLSPPDSFNFPFDPYQIQKNFMQELFKVIENKQIGIFESPTGTGKTLTLTCGALTWLIEHETAVSIELEEKINTLSNEIKKLDLESSKSNDWINGQYETLQLKQKLSEVKSELDSLLEYKKWIKDIRSNREIENEIKKFIKNKENNDEMFDDKQTHIDTNDSDDEFLINDIPDEDSLENDISETSKYHDTKIYFCSRTHSQLSQVVHEIKKTVFGRETRVTALASRQNYCINPEVKSLQTNSLINERCLELQKGTKGVIRERDSQRRATKKSKTSKKCPFYNQLGMEKVKNEAISEIYDIEDLIQVAKSHKACPYYASRLAASDSQVIMVPYQMILHKKTRDQLGINIQGSVLIIDEAHNLLDTISSIHSAQITLKEFVEVKNQLESYKKRYLSRFSAKTVLKMNQLIYIAKQLISFFKTVETSKMIPVSELLTEAELFNINISELLRFAKDTRLAEKLHGFAVSESKRQEKIKCESGLKQETGLKSYLKQLEESKRKIKNKIPSKATEPEPMILSNTEKVLVVNAIRPFLSLLECLLEEFEDGRILISTDNENNGTMKYLVLNPGAHFKDLLNQCRAIILAGGTMQPVSELTEQLFSECKDRVKIHLYSHVVKQDAVLPLVLTKGPTGKEFLFNFSNKNNRSMLQELAATLLNICNVVPAGVVCFFSSYDTLEGFYKFFDENGFLKRIQLKKRVFLEKRNGMQAETLLDQYSKAIKFLKNNSKESQNGALLFSVVGGKLSEGLNFSDDLGRCVIVVGLPYPNKFSPELQEKMKYLDKNLNSSAGNEYYENLCMKAVNQCIGRAVRHINDYASVILLDVRYGNEKIRKKLPMWIERGLIQIDGFGKGQAELVKFFKEKKILN
uniref:DNA 5'-3' helicase n=1 Tax=Culicoides sonorensis TaxID=179676 RepID=A0A336KTI8_CULSO